MRVSEYFGPSTIYLSPHRDDICFSLGGAISCNPGGHLINVFTRSTFAPSLSLPLDLDDRIATVTRSRKIEDSYFAEHNRLRVHDLHFAEPAVRGISPFSSITQCAVDAISNELLSVIINICNDYIASGVKVALLCPLGVGKHVDHLTVLMCILNHYKELDQVARVAFYEDLPYGIAERNTKSAIAFLKECDIFDALFRLEIPLTDQMQSEKLLQIAAYASQKGVFPLTEISKSEALWTEVVK